MKRACHGALLCAALLAASVHAAEASCNAWPEWAKFKQLYLSEDGRVVDASTDQRVTVSEGQAYALLFALVGNDRVGFDTVLEWTRNNLAHGDLGHSLAAWKWGRAADGRWTVLDANSASDADVWMSYALAEAARLWRTPAYGDISRALSESILREEVALVPGLGSTLLPGPRGFVSGEIWRLNASYSPIQALRVVARQSGNALWDQVLASSDRVILASIPRGYAADWIAYRSNEGFFTDPATHGVGSYDAIRVYLWSGMLADADPRTRPLAHALEPMIAAAAKHPVPESIDTVSLETHGEGSPGFTAALLPSLERAHADAAVQAARAQIETAALKNNQHYFSDALTLFGLGWLDGRYRFDRQGRLEVPWTGPCGTR
jgi:endoglucanase